MSDGPETPRRRGRPRGGQPARWEILYQAMVDLEPGELISYERIGRLLNLDHTNPKDKLAIAACARRAVEVLAERAKKVAVLVRGEGYEIADPDGILVVARRHQRRAFDEVAAGAGKVGTIDTSRLDTTTARLVIATEMALARQAAHMRHLDIRQGRLDTVMGALAVTVEAPARTVEAPGRADRSRPGAAGSPRQIQWLPERLLPMADQQTS